MNGVQAIVSPTYFYKYTLLATLKGGGDDAGVREAQPSAVLAAEGNLGGNGAHPGIPMLSPIFFFGRL